MSLLVIIPARGGSIGIPRKNIKPLAGKPLIGWTINAAKQANYIDKIVVSTEDKEIAFVSRQFGAEVPFIRPAVLAKDDTSSFATVLHAIDQLPNFDWVLLLQPTSPLRTFADIEAIWKLCQKQNSPSAVSISEVSKHPCWMYIKDNKGKLKLFVDGYSDIKRRQDLPVVYALNGALYLAKTKWLIEQGSFLGAETQGYIMPPERSVDIDTLHDWRWAEYLIEQKND